MQNTKTLRSGILTLATTLAIFASFAHPAHAEESAACGAHPVAALPLTFRGDGVITVDADIGAPQPLPFVVDLDHPESQIRDDLATALKLEINGATAGERLYRGDKELRARGAIHAVKLGGVDAGRVRAYLTPGVSGVDPFISSIPAGVLGRRVFEQFDIELDLAGGMMNLFPPADCPLPLYARMDSERVHMDLGDESLDVKVLIDGKEADAELHTATCCSQMSLSLAHDKLGVDANAAGLTPLPVKSGPPAFVSTIKSLTLGSTSIANPPLAIVDMTGRSYHHMPHTAQDLMTICESCQHVQIGLRELAHFHLYFAFGKRTLYVAPATSQ